MLEEPLTAGVRCKFGAISKSKKKGEFMLGTLRHDPSGLFGLADLDPKITARAKTSDRTKYLSKMGYSKYDTVYN